MQVTIALEPDEILDHVDSMLAWEAVASEQKGLRYSWAAIKRAEPLVRIDKDTWGILTPNTVEVFVETEDDRAMTMVGKDVARLEGVEAVSAGRYHARIWPSETPA